MRCPRCAYKGKLFQGRCAVCGYPLEEETQKSTEGGTAAVQQPFLQSSDQYSPLINQYSPILDLYPMKNRQPTKTSDVGNTLRNGRYRLQERITLPVSQQNQGTAWNAYDLQMSSRFVVVREVTLSSELASTPAQKEYIANKIAQRLNKLGEHPGLPKVVDLFSENGAYFLVFLYPQGETLASVLRRWQNGLPEYMVAEYAWQLCSILVSLSEQQPPLVHGAISPETILISEEGQNAVLMHLPLLPPREPGGKTENNVPGYRAPEQVHGSITPASDLYSLAATLYHAVTGSDPQKRPASFYPPARRLNAKVSPALELVLARQLHLTVVQRYSGPHEMLQDIAALIESYVTQATRAIVPLQASEVPQLVLKDEENKKPIFSIMKKWVIPLLVGMMVLLGVVLILVLHP